MKILQSNVTHYPGIWSFSKRSRHLVRTNFCILLETIKPLIQESNNKNYLSGFNYLLLCLCNSDVPNGFSFDLCIQIKIFEYTLFAKKRNLRMSIFLLSSSNLYVKRIVFCHWNRFSDLCIIILLRLEAMLILICDRKFSSFW